ncbi:MFS transporter [Siculibacillus lacustris]|uniref:MFS transporter n=1 Tax=Siculibacillus lacustris TaxID=1549641 RepID=A0A4Q9VHB0_9HYPH|nr:MFS transporter [Siculibacillus lacustris]TBW34503.1 MFS transporter [Siculibacillus lacustris]
MTRRPRPAGPLSLVLALALTQIIGWGTTYYMPSGLAEALARDLGFSTETTFLGVTIMVALGGVFAPAAGRLFDRRGVARSLSYGSMLIAGGLFLFAAVPSRTTWFVTWVAFGLAQSLCLTLASQTLVTRLGGVEARHQISWIALLTGLSATVFWPVTAALDAVVGWRATLWIFGLLNLVVVLPVHLWIAARWHDGDEPTAPDEEPTGAVRPLVDPRRRRWAAGLMTFAFAAQGFAAWGLPLHFISMFEVMGLDRATAVTIAAMSGPASVAARGIELTLGRRLGPLTVTLIAMTILTPAIGLAFLPFAPSAGIIAFVILWSGANGILAVLRATLPLSLLGSRDFGTLSGGMMLPQNLVFAASPTAFAIIIGVGGATAGVLTALVGGLLGLAAALPLVGLVRAERAAVAAAAAAPARRP